jgi:hypothetical protein
MSDKEKESKKKRKVKNKRKKGAASELLQFSAYPQTRQFFEWRDMSSRSQQPGC